MIRVGKPISKMLASSPLLFARAIDCMLAEAIAMIKMAETTSPLLSPTLSAFSSPSVGAVGSFLFAKKRLAAWVKLLAVKVMEFHMVASPMVPPNANISQVGVPALKK